jgi:hypothetical protein
MLKDVDYMLSDQVKRVYGPMDAAPATVIKTLETIYAGN